MNAKIAALVAGLTLCAGLCAAQQDTDIPANQPQGEQPPNPREGRRRQAPEPPREERHQGNRMNPQQVFPGDLPEKTTTPGTIDRESRVLQDNRTNIAPPAGPEDRPQRRENGNDSSEPTQPESRP